MISHPYRPSPPAHVSTPDGGATIVFTRVLAHPPELVWAALTDPAQLAQWAPFTADRNLASTGPAELTMDGDTDRAAFPAEIRASEPPHVLEYTWGADVLRWVLEPAPAGTMLTLRHTLSDTGMGSAAAAGWHICLDVADGLLAGRPFGPITGGRAREFGWDDLNETYARELGVPASQVW